jgi:hypothetical protein
VLKVPAHRDRRRAKPTKVYDLEVEEARGTRPQPSLPLVQWLSRKEVRGHGAHHTAEGHQAPQQQVDAGVHHEAAPVQHATEAEAEKALVRGERAYILPPLAEWAGKR